MPSENHSLNELVAAYLSACADGTAKPAEEFIRGRPELRDDFLKRISLMKNNVHTVAADETPLDQKLSSASTLKTRPTELGGFKILRPLGSGGMGIVFVAQQIETKQLVALKMLREERIGSQDCEIRFRRESKTFALLSHDHIVPMIAAGIEDGTAYIAMALIDGIAMHEVITLKNSQSSTATQTPAQSHAVDARTPLTSSTILDCLIKLQRGDDYYTAIARTIASIADALEFAHSKGVIHRDVKPSNIILDTNGKAWLTDFGLATTQDDATVVTQTGDVVGTPAYLSPEQVTLSYDSLDCKTDIYSLGTTLFELATSVKPFQGNRNQILLKVSKGDLPNPSKFCPDIPARLEAIILKAMAYSPDARYASAKTMADDLRRFSRGDQVDARLPGVAERMYHWIERNPLTSLVSICGVIATLAAVFSVQAMNSNTLQSINKQLENSNQQLLDSNLSLEQRESELREQLYVANISAAFKAFESRNIPAVRQHLEEPRFGSRKQEHRRFPWQLLNNLTSTRSGVELTKHEAAATELEIFPCGTKAISVGEDGYAHVFDIARDTIPKKLQIGSQLNAVAVLKNEEAFVTGQNAVQGYNVVSIHDLSTGEVVAQTTGHEACVESLAVSPDGQRIASADRYREVQIFDSSGTLETKFTTDSRNESLAFLPDSNFLASVVRLADKTQVLRIRNLKDQSIQDVELGFSPNVFAISEGNRNSNSDSPLDELHIVAAGMNQLSVVRWPSGERVAFEQDVTGRIRCVAISPDGKTVVAGCDEGMIFVWHCQRVAKDGRLHPAQVLDAGDQCIESIKLVLDNPNTNEASDNSLRIVTSSRDGSVRLWDIPKAIPERIIRPMPSDPLDTNPATTPAQNVRGAWAPNRYSSDLQLRFTDGTIAAFNGRTKELRVIATVPIDYFGRILLTPDGRNYVAAAPDHLVIIDAKTGKERHRLPAEVPGQNCTDLLVLKNKLYALFNTYVTVTDLKTFQQIGGQELPADDTRQLVKIPNSDEILIVTQKKLLKLSAGKISIVESAETPGEYYREICFSRSGKMRAVIHNDNSVLVSAVDGSTTPVLFRGHRDQVTDCLFLDDNSTLVTSALDRSLRFWDIATGRELGALQFQDAQTHHLHFFEETQTLATLHVDSPLELWPAGATE